MTRFLRPGAASFFVEGRLDKEYVMSLTFGDAVFNKVVLAVEQTLYVERRPLLSSTRLVDDLKLGRFGRIRLALYLEEIFDLEISDDVVDCFDTVGDIAHYMSRWSLVHAGAPWVGA